MVLPDREEELVPASVAAELREEEEDQSDPAEDLRTTKVTSSSGRNLDANSSTSSASPAPSSSSPNLHTLQFINTCECCTERAADWWCPADQAYFCHTCDQSVHSANAFSSRHERERISPEPLTGRDPVGDESDPEPVLSGCKRKSSGSCPISGPGSSPRHKMIKAESEILPEEDSNPEEVDEDVFQDIDLFLAGDEDRNNNNNNNSSSSFSSNPNSNSNTNTNNSSRENEEAQEEEEEQQQQQREQQGDGLIVPRMSDTCDNLNELLGLSGFDPQEEEDESRFDFAIRKNNVVRLIDGPDEVDGFYTRLVKLEDNHLQLHHHQQYHQLDEKLKPKLEEEEEEEEGEDAEVSNRSVELLQLQIPLLKKSLLENPKEPWLKLDVKDVQNCWQSGLFLQDVKDAKPLAPVDSISDAAGSSDVGVVPDMSRSRKSGHSEEQAAQVPVHMPGDLDSPGGREARSSSCIVFTGDRLVKVLAGNEEPSTMARLYEQRSSMTKQLENLFSLQRK